MVEPVEDPSVEDLTRWHRTFAPRFFNHTWDLMDLEELDDDQRDELLSSAFAQRAHWYQVGTPRQRAIADWQVSRAAVVAGFPALAARFGERSLRVGADQGPFVSGFAHEAIARAAASVDDVETFETHVTAARELVAHIEDDQERTTLQADLDQMSR